MRFAEKNAHVFKARLNHNSKPKGARFEDKDISFSLTPQDDDLERAILISISDQK